MRAAIWGGLGAATRNGRDVRRAVRRGGRRRRPGAAAAPSAAAAAAGALPAATPGRGDGGLRRRGAAREPGGGTFKTAGRVRREPQCACRGGVRVEEWARGSAGVELRGAAAAMRAGEFDLESDRADARIAFKPPLFHTSSGRLLGSTRADRVAAIGVGPLQHDAWTYASACAGVHWSGACISQCVHGALRFPYAGRAHRTHACILECVALCILQLRTQARDSRASDCPQVLGSLRRAAAGRRWRVARAAQLVGCGARHTARSFRRANRRFLEHVPALTHAHTLLAAWRGKRRLQSRLSLASRCKPRSWPGKASRRSLVLA